MQTVQDVPYEDNAGTIILMHILLMSKSEPKILSSTKKVYEYKTSTTPYYRCKTYLQLLSALST